MVLLEMVEWGVKVEGYKIIKCINCGLVQLNPTPNRSNSFTNLMSIDLTGIKNMIKRYSKAYDHEQNERISRIKKYSQ